jgi:hypothetical protein
MVNNKVIQVFLFMLLCLGSLGQAGQLVYSTFFGGSTTDISYDIAIDNAGNAYITGYSSSSIDFPITAGAVDTTYNGGSYDIFISKLSADGSTLIYSTFLGGSGREWGNSIALDTAGNIVISGYTDSSNFPVTPNAFDTTLSGMGDAFISKISADGSSLIFSTLLGGSSEDESRGLTLDSAGNIYITGRTQSSNFPISPGAIDSTLTDFLFDVFVSKLSADGSSLLYSTYLGGPSTLYGDNGNGIAVDNGGNAFVTGVTDSSSFPTTPGAFDTTHNGSNDAFVSKLNSTGTALIYSTFLGGSGSDAAEDIALDNAGNTYITGYTSSPSFPTTAGAFDTTYDGGVFDVFISKLTADGSALVYSTFFGGSDRDWGMHIALDNKKSVFITGYTASSTNFPTTPTAIDTLYNGSNDVFVSKFNMDGSILLYSTYFGGSNSDSGNGIAVDNAGNVYITGSTLSSDFPITLGAFDPTYNGSSSDAFVSKLYIIPTAIDNSYWQDYQ